jgi:hypothetical protein
MSIEYTPEELKDYDQLNARGRRYYDDMRQVGIFHQDAFHLAHWLFGLKSPELLAIMKSIKESPMSKHDELIREYSETLRKIYEDRTAGDYTFQGVLVMFAMKLQELDAETQEEAPEQPVTTTITTPVPSETRFGVEYIVTETFDVDGALLTSTCSCPSYQFRAFGNKTCKHIERRTHIHRR